MTPGLSRCGRDDVGGWLDSPSRLTLAVMGGPIAEGTEKRGYPFAMGGVFHDFTCRFAIARQGSPGRRGRARAKIIDWDLPHHTLRLALDGPHTSHTTYHK